MKSMYGFYDLIQALNLRVPLTMFMVNVVLVRSVLNHFLIAC